jgi:hypothetical protein
LLDQMTVSSMGRDDSRPNLTGTDDHSIDQLHRIVWPLMGNFGVSSLIFNSVIKNDRQPPKFPTWSAL